MRAFILITIMVALNSCSIFPTMENRARGYLETELKDSDSAKFKDLRESGSAICGKVNAKNGLGNYTGYEDFYASEGLVILGSDEHFGPQLSNLCTI